LDTSDTTDVIAAAQPTQGRRVLALVALIMLGIVVIYVALFRDGTLGARVVLLALGVMALWGADHMRRATAARVELTEEGLRDSDGVMIVALADVLKVERGLFAFKPSNGFLIHTKATQVRGWRLGLWWRFGKRVGIGGMMPVHQTKVMAERIAMLLEDRS
jgi:hypothetical protein